MLSTACALLPALQQRLEQACPSARCELHQVALDEPALKSGDDTQWLSDDDRDRAARMRFAIHASRWLRARAALRELLAERVGRTRAMAPFAHGAAGKPQLDGHSQSDPQWHFSVSHSHELAMVACTTVVEPGIDIERIRIDRDHAAMLDLIGSEAELREFDASGIDPRQRGSAFVQLWTRKEAVVKARGVGIGFGLSRVDVGCADRPRLNIDGHPAHRTLLHDLPSPPGYRAALCLQLPGDDDLPVLTRSRKANNARRVRL